MRFRRIMIILASVLAGALFFSGSLAAEETGGKRIAVLLSRQGTPYEETLDGFRKYLGKKGIPARFTVFPLKGNMSNAVRAVQKVKRDRPDLLFTVGTLATGTALKEISDIPIIAGLVYRLDALQKSSNATGVSLEFPLETQIQLLRRILPEARSIGVLYNPAENEDRIKDAAKVAKNMGVLLVAREVKSPKDLPAALESLVKRADTLWGVYDTVALTPETAKHILLFSFRNHIPLVGLSASWVKAGALYAPEWDYEDMGMQCGQMACEVMQGAPTGSIRPATPRSMKYSLNLKTARRLKIEFPDALVRRAHQVF